MSRVLIDRFGVLSDSMLVRGRTFLAIGRQRAAAGKKDEAVANWKNAAKVFELALKIDPENFHLRRGLTEAERRLSRSRNEGVQPRFMVRRRYSGADSRGASRIVMYWDLSP